MIAKVSGNTSLYGTGPILSKISKEPKNLGFMLLFFLNLNIPLIEAMVRKTFTHEKLEALLAKVCVAFLSSLCSIYSLSDLLYCCISNMN